MRCLKAEGVCQTLGITKIDDTNIIIVTDLFIKIVKDGIHA